MSASRLSNPLALAVLVLLWERPMHPYEMSTTLRERHKEASIKLNYGSLYSVVASLQKYGLIAVQETVREGNRPERTIYAIAEAGKAKMIDWLSELISIPSKEFTGFEAALSLMPALEPDEVIRLLEMRLGRLQGAYHMSKGLQASLPVGFPRIFVIETEFRDALLDTEIRFVQTLLHDLKTGQLSGLQGWRRIHELRATGASAEEVNAILATEFQFGVNETEAAEGQP